MTIDEAKYVSEWNKDPRKAMWHPDTEEAMDWLIGEVERMISEGPRLFTSGTPLASIPELRAKLSHTGAPEGPL